MIDLHCHLLPGIDDGAIDNTMSLGMARAMIEDGVEAVICTPHILPGLYHNTGPQIRNAVANLRARLTLSDIKLDLYCGADAHIAVDFVAKLERGEIPTLADSRYVLIELPQHVEPVLIRHFFFQLLVGGYVPILSHPERLRWIEGQFDVIKRLVQSGVWIQLTAGSLLGEFGKAPKYWSERMLDDGIVHVLATDAHNNGNRSPNLRKARDIAAKRLGEREAENLVKNRPHVVLCDHEPDRFPVPSASILSIHPRHV